MSVIDKVIAAVVPEPSAEKMQQVRADARKAAGNSGWLALVIDHHIAIEGCFEAVKNASSASTRSAAQKKLAVMLTAHSIAEESVVYPAMALTDQKGHATEAYAEQSAAKIQMAALDALDPMSEDYLDKLEHIRGAVAHHVYEEESDYFVKLRQNGDSAMQAKLTRKYPEEFSRYAGPDA